MTQRERSEKPTPTNFYEAQRLRALERSYQTNKQRGLEVLHRAFREVQGEPNPWLHQISPYAVARVRTWLLSHQHTSRSQAANAMKVLSSGIQAARLEGSIRMSPLTLVRWGIPLPGKMRILTAQEWARLSEECRKEGIHLWARAAIAYHLGLRISEIYGLEIRGINLVDQLLTAPTRKGNERANKDETRQLPIPPQLHAILHQLMQTIRPTAKPEELLFASLPPQAQGQKPGQIQKGQRAWNRARARSGLHDVRFHDLRHTFATRMHERGAGTYDLMQALGHSHESSVARYVHPDAERIRRFIK